MEDRTSYFVINYDETRGAGSGPSSFIPTLGAASTALDQYRTAGIHSTNLHELGAAFTDITAIAALAKVAEGGLASVRDLEAAETALQALLLHHSSCRHPRTKSRLRHGYDFLLPLGPAGTIQLRI
jgi:hypothetical protein